MAEIIASEILKSVLAKLASEAMNRYVRSQGIHSELTKLERTLFQIQNLLTDASQKEIADKAVKEWLISLQHLAYDIDDILDDFATEAMHLEFIKESGIMNGHVRKLIPTCCTNIALDDRMRHKLDNVTIKLQDLEKEKNMLGLIVKNEKPKNINRKFQTSLVDGSSIVGRQGEKEALVHKLMGDEVSDKNINVVPIVGMGGIGKTTLARLLYDEKLVKDHFELKAWVCVSDDFDSLGISKVIFQSLGGGNMEGKNMEGENEEEGNNERFADLNLLQVALRDKTREKRFLLVLDDVWSESYDDWEILVRPFHTCAPGSKIIITTRKEQLVTKLCYGNLNHLQILSHDDAMCLFAQHALGEKNFDLHLELKPHGEGIVKKCDGLPLALTTVGRLLRTRKEEEYWKEVLNSEVWRLQDGGGIVPALRLSYQDLSAHLKQLFAYCSLFPKGYVFDKEQLVLLWMAEGFLNQLATDKSTTERLGNEYFDELLSRSLFQHAPNNESLFVMHDLLNDLATSVAGDFFVRLDNEMENDIKKKTLEKYRHMSFVRMKYVAYKKFEVFRRAKSLRTFLGTSIGVKESWQRFYLSNKILVDLLPELTVLRVLCLSGYEISEVPESIGSLKHLRYLNLSQTKITHLSENVGNLYNLETLILFGCQKLMKLPKSFIKLKNLRHFDIRDTPLLNKMPLGIGELKSLQTLSKIIIGGGNKFEITELSELKNLGGEISIKGLDKVKNAVQAREVNFSQKSLSELEVEWSDIFDGSRKETLEKKVLNELKPRDDTLKQLKIVSYWGTEFPDWVGDPSFYQLKHVSIRGCKKCISLPPLGQLPSLKELFVKGLDGVKFVGSDLLGSGVAFRSLEILSFEDMKGWKEWSTNSGDVFPCLEELSISNCPNLEVISLEALPTVRVLKVIRCDNGVLRSLVDLASSVRKLIIESISGLTDEVWGGVIEYLRGVEELNIYMCKEIRYLWESEAKASMVLVNLSKLKVVGCANLVSLGKKEEENNRGSNLVMTSLRKLELSSCWSMECCTCPNSIETLHISGCDSMTAISFPKGRGQQLKSVFIFLCSKLVETEFRGGDKSSSGLINKKRSATMLEDISIYGWQNLKSIIDLDYLVHLTRLEIKGCSSLESFPDHHLPNLTSLRELVIYNSPNMDASFPRIGGFWPPNLQSLNIGGLKKPMSEWGTQNFPASLVDLTLNVGKTEDDVTDISKLSHLLPSSLTSLKIMDFKKLKTISAGLQHLTSIQHLYIWGCPKVIDLPEMLLPSLLSLKIWWSPKLKERCTGIRSCFYRPKISHIPKLEIVNNIIPYPSLFAILLLFVCSRGGGGLLDKRI